MTLDLKGLSSKDNKKMMDGLGICFGFVFYVEKFGKLAESVEISSDILYIKINMGRNNYIKGEIR